MKRTVRVTSLTVFALLVTSACVAEVAPEDLVDADDGTATQITSDTATCATVTDAAPLAVATAADADEYALRLTAQSASATSWGAKGNEALVLEVSGAKRGFIGHLVLHQGQTKFAYGMHLGALAADEAISVRVSSLSAPQATKSACVSAALTPASAMGSAAEGLVHAPIYRWPIEKSFDDVPLVGGWSRTRKAYQGVMTNENGGTAEQCGGGADGMQAEIARWGRASDIEQHYSYANAAAPTWERCTGTVPVTKTAIRMEAAHPQLYYGDGHNRLFESRGGYGQTCGTGSPEEPQGKLAGWNTANPGNDLAHDAGNVIVLRPLPYDMDALGYVQSSGRREGIADQYAPWLYRLTALELQREGKVDNKKVLGMSRYLYADVRVDDVGGSGDQYCAFLGVSGGFKLRAVTTKGQEISSAQITGDYAGGNTWKRVAIPLPAGTTAADIDHFRFDAYDGDGIYLLGIGDAFIPEASGGNGATISYVRQGETALKDYVDDDRSSCTGSPSVNTGGPGGAAYACSGSYVDVK